jgi:hypothetical protein
VGSVVRIAAAGGVFVVLGHGDGRGYGLAPYLRGLVEGAPLAHASSSDVIEVVHVGLLDEEAGGAESSESGVERHGIDPADVGADRLLPLGTVVRLCGGTHAVMICGLAQRQVGGDCDGRVWDYSGVPWPEGAFDPRRSVLFDDSQVEVVFFLGLPVRSWAGSLSRGVAGLGGGS